MPKTLCGVLLLGLATLALGQQEEFIGVWESIRVEGGSAVTVRVEYEPDGQFELTIRSTTSREAFLQAGEDEGGEAGQDPGADLSFQILAGLFPDSLALAVDARGTWEVAGDSLFLDAQTSQTRFNGLEPAAFLDGLGRELARTLAATLGVAEADYPAFEEQVLTQFAAGAGAGFEEFSPDDIDLRGTYAFHDGVLAIADEEGEVTRWSKVTSSAVAAATWGAVKAGAGRSGLRP